MSHSTIKMSLSAPHHPGAPLKKLKHISESIMDFSAPAPWG